MSCGSSNLVSVIIPVGSQNSFIDEAIGSVLGQVYQDCEIIICGNPSSARFSIPEDVRRGRNRVKLVAGGNSLSAAINSAIFQSTGEFVSLLRPDDAYEANRIHSCLSDLKSAEAQCCFTYVRHTDNEGVSLPCDHPVQRNYDRMIAREFNLTRLSSALLLSGDVLGSWGNLVIKRELALALGPLLDDVDVIGQEFLSKLADVTEPILVPQYLYRHRVPQKKTIRLSFYNRIRKTAISLIPKSIRPRSLSPTLSISAQHGKLGTERPIWSDLVSSQSPRGGSSDVEVARPLPANRPAARNLSRPHLTPITLVTHDLSYSGAPTLVLDIAVELRKRGHDVRVISLNPGALAAEFAKDAIPVLVLPAICQRGRRHIPTLCWMAIIRPFIRGPILVNSAESFPVLTALSKVVSSKRQIRWYIHERVPVGIYCASNRMWAEFSRLYARDAFRAWFGSQSTADFWSAQGIRGKTLYWSGIPRVERAVSVRPIKRLLFVGSIVPRKGVHYLLEAFSNCIRRGDFDADIQLTIIGFGAKESDYERDILSMVAVLDLKHRVRLFGILDRAQLTQHYADADLYVHPSVMEGMPLALLTAMAKGIPVVTTSVDGCREAIPSDRYGWSCASRSATALSRGMLEAIRNPAIAFERARAAKAHFDATFSFEATADRLFDDIRCI